MKTGFYRYALHDRSFSRLKELKFRRPTAVQEKVIPLIFQGKNLIVEAATGTGKTAAYGLPILARIDYLKTSIQTLILVPSRELALQVERAIKSYIEHDKLKVEAIYGGSPLADSEAKIKRSPHVLIAVPGRLRDALRDNKFPWFWRNIKHLVIDEADKLLEVGFDHETEVLLTNLRNVAQVTLFSATISPEVEALVREKWKPITTIRLSHREALKNIDFYGVKVEEGQTERYLAGLLQQTNLSSALIFCNKREEVMGLAGFLRGMGHPAEAYHGLMDQIEREAIMGRFRNGQLRFLIATDLAARGLDIPDLPAVINFSLPEELEVYLHRAGRTGRAGEHGSCYNLITSVPDEIYTHQFHREVSIKLRELEIEPVEELKKVQNKAVKIHLNRGKKDKIRPGDVVGFLVNEFTLSPNEVGTIAIYDQYTTVDVPENALRAIENRETTLKIKGKTVKARKYGIEEQKARAKGVQKRVISSRKREARKKRRG